MPFQTLVQGNIAAGIPGELAFEGPLRAQPLRLNSTDATNNVFGRVLRIVGNAAAQDGTNAVAGAGGTGVFAGILVSPKEHVSYGTLAGGTLGASFVLANGTLATGLTMGEVFVLSSTTANIGDLVWSNDTTGAIAATAPGVTTLSGHTQVPFARFERFPVQTAGGLAVIKITE